MYSNATVCTRTAEGFSSEIPVLKGVQQGNTLSPTLFTVFINDIPQYMLNQSSSYIKDATQTKIQCLLYADDMFLLSTTKAGLQGKLNQLHEYCKESGLNISRDNTKVIVFTRTDPKVPIFFKCGDDNIQTTYEYTYLGVCCFSLTKTEVLTMLKNTYPNK